MAVGDPHPNPVRYLTGGSVSATARRPSVSVRYSIPSATPRSQDHILERAYGRSSAIDPDAIRRNGLNGVATGVRELVASMHEGWSRLAALSENLSHALKRDAIVAIPISNEAVERPLWSGGGLTRGGTSSVCGSEERATS
jgi:hypothetical protein